jgi:hypothetical protein
MSYEVGDKMVADRLNSPTVALQLERLAVEDCDATTGNFFVLKVD